MKLFMAYDLSQHEAHIRSSRLTFKGKISANEVTYFYLFMTKLALKCLHIRHQRY